MPPVSPERFTALFRTLDPAERRAFVADLWAARGWTTTVEGEEVTATRDGARRRIRVADPGRFGSPSVDGVDVLVTTRDREALRGTTDTRGVEYLPPTDVHELLLYGIERETAARVFRERFGQRLDDADPPVSLRERINGPVRAAWSTLAGSRRLTLVLLIGLLVGAAVAGPALSPADPAVTTVPNVTVTADEVGAVGGGTAATAAPSGTENPLPPGLSEDGIRDLRMLADAHSGGVRNDQRTLSVSADGPPDAPYMQGAMAWNYTVRIEAPRIYVFESGFRFPASRFPPENETSADAARVGIFTAGDTKYRRQVDPTGTAYQRYFTDATGDASGYASDIKRYLLTFLDAEETSVSCAQTVASGRCESYLVTATGAPDALPNGTESFRATALVRQDGVVREFRATYTLPDGEGGRERVAFRFIYDFSPVDVAAPDWVPEARNETDG